MTQTGKKTTLSIVGAAANLGHAPVGGSGCSVLTKRRPVAPSTGDEKSKGNPVASKYGRQQTNYLRASLFCKLLPFRVNLDATFMSSQPAFLSAGWTVHT